MPNVGMKKFPYTLEGKADAMMAAKKTGKKMVVKKAAVKKPAIKKTAIKKKAK